MLQYKLAHFVYRACDAQEVTRYPWTFKLINESYAMKTLIFAVDSEFDLQASRC